MRCHQPPFILRRLSGVRPRYLLPEVTAAAPTASCKGALARLRREKASEKVLGLARLLGRGRLLGQTRLLSHVPMLNVGRAEPDCLLASVGPHYQLDVIKAAARTTGQPS